jgi:hypothetical protein
VRDSFLSRPLKAQCEELGISLDTLQMEKTGPAWLFSENLFYKPEPAAFAHFESLGFKGNHCEGAAPLMLLKCAALDYLAEANIFHDRSDACLRYFEAQCTILKSYSSRIIENVQSATDDSIRRHFSEIRSKALYSTLYPEMSVDGLLAIWQSIGPDGWAKICESFCQDPYTFRAGWPDLSIATGSSLQFVEIKTTDKLHTNQKVTISGLLLPLKLQVSVLKLVQLPSSGLACP